MVFTVYSLVYLLTSLASFIVGFLAIQRKAVVGAWELFFLALSVAFNTYFCFFESMVVTQELKAFWSAVGYLGAVNIPVFYLLFVLRFTKLIRFKSIRFGWALFVFPVITVVIAFTNSQHHLLWSEFSPIDPKTNVMIYGHGDWFWVGYTLYSYVLLFVTSFLIFSFIVKNRKKRAYWIQGFLIFIGGLIPWITSILYITGSSPFKGLDIVPISTLISAILFTDSIIRSSFLNLIPVARETLVETLPLGILALDRQNRIQDSNEWARKVLNIKQSDVLGMTLKEAMNRSERMLQRLQSMESPVEMELVLPEGTRYYIVTKKLIVSIPGSRLITIQDITDQMERQNELDTARLHAEESDRLKSAFLANMSHEIRTPMNGIVGFVSLLQRDDVSAVEREQYLEIIRVNCFRLLGTLNDIIDLSKIESGQMPLVKHEMDLNELVDSMVELFKPEAFNKKLDFQVETQMLPLSGRIVSDKNKIYSIVIKLIKNAIKYTNEGYVRFECRLKDSNLIIRISDSGIGIDSSQQKLIFERFVQASDYSNRMFEGTGLGLSITKAYVEMLDGKLLLESEVGKGSVFYVELPVELLVE